MTAMRLHRYPSPSGGFALGKMGVGATMMKIGYSARDYFQNGIGLQFDGIENAGCGIHDSTATTLWKDLIGNNDAVGVVDEITDIGPRATSETRRFSFTTPLSVNSTAWTMETCFLTAYHSGYWVVLASYEGSQHSRFQINIEGDMRFHFIPNGVVNTLNSGITNDELKNGTLAVTWDGSTLKMYWNGVLTSQTTMTSAQWGSTLRSTTCSLFSRYDLNYSFIEPFWGTICAHRTYTICLPATEIAANYAIDKERFNLP